MDALKDPKLAEAVDFNLAGGKGAVRTRAIKLLASRADAQAKLTHLLTSSIADEQAAIETIGTIEAPWAQEIIAKELDQLIAGKLAPEVQLEVIEAADKSKLDAVKAKRKQFDDSRPKDNPLASNSESLLGGDASVGRKIFLERQDVACLRCHKLDGTGGVAGPDLSGIASRHERAYFLESLVNPNAQIAPGFEAVTVQVKAGKSYSGVAKSETDAQITIDAGDGATIQIDKKEVASRTKGLSAMPQDIAKALSKRDLRDVVEFLSTLKQPTTQPASPATTKVARQ
jgi:quinoprotein glucose dehydrogenase